MLTQEKISRTIRPLTHQERCSIDIQLFNDRSQDEKNSFISRKEKKIGLKENDEIKVGTSHHMPYHFI